MEIKLPFLPPTQNRYFIRARGRLIKGPAARIFSEKVAAEKIRQFHKLKQFAGFNNRLLRVDTYYVIDKTRIWTKKSQIKQIDFMNLQKQAWDALATLIEIDDKYYKSGYHELIECNSSTEECIIFNITVQDSVKTYEDFLKCKKD